MKERIPKRVMSILAVSVVFFIAAAFVRKQPDARAGIKVSGTIETTDVRVSFRVAGKIKELLTDEGKTVKAGETVAVLDTDELSKIETEAEGALKAAQSAYERARDDYRRLENLFQAGAVSAQKRDAAKTNADASKASADALNASAALATLRLGFATLVSPIDGYVLSKSAEAGEFVQPGATIFTVADVKNVWLTAYINETDLGKVKLNQEAEITVDSYPHKVYKGKISFIAQESEFTPKQIQTT